MRQCLSECVCLCVRYLDVSAVCYPLGQLLRSKANPLQVKGVGPLWLALSWEMHEGWSAVHVQLERTKTWQVKTGCHRF